MPRSRNGQRYVAVELRRHRDRDRIHLVEDLPEIRARGRTGRGRGRGRALGVGVDNRDQLRPFEPAQDPRMMTPEVADPDHRDTDALTRAR